MRPTRPVDPPAAVLPAAAAAAAGHAASSVRPDERDRFNALAATWWNPLGPMRPLHAVNALRLDAVVQRVQAHHRRDAAQGLAGLRVLDLGCGAGLMSEPLARLGACVTGIDAAERNIAAATLHARAGGVALDYRCGEAATTLAADERFDVVLLLEVVEHVADVPAFVADAARHLAPGGLLIASTIDRTLKSFVVAIVGAEWLLRLLRLLRLLPRGTHHWRRFVRPAELAAAMAGQGLQQRHLQGMRYDPLRHRASWCTDTRVNYLASYAANPQPMAPERRPGPILPPPAQDHP